MKKITKLKDMIGLTVKSVSGGKIGDEEIIINTDCGVKLKIYHIQSCCESVSINDIDDEINCIVGGLITEFEQVSNSENKPENKSDEYADSWTWTFIKIATTNGFVNIRWLGESNGCYSESVDFAVFTGDEDDYSYGAGFGWVTIE